jgi:hypothetical protein
MVLEGLAQSRQRTVKNELSRKLAESSIGDREPTEGERRATKNTTTRKYKKQKPKKK